MPFQEIIDSCDAFINLTCKDAATKTVCTAINNRLPVLYANSGGVGELVGPYGLGIPEKDEIEILDEVPGLDPKKVDVAFTEFKERYYEYSWHIEKMHMPASRLFKSIGGYFREIRNLVEG